MYYFSNQENSEDPFSHYAILNNTLGPFDTMDNAQLKQKIYDSDYMSLNFAVRQYVNPESPAQGTCYEE